MDGSQNAPLWVILMDEFHKRHALSHTHGEKGESYEAFPCTDVSDHLSPPVDDVRRCHHRRLPRRAAAVAVCQPYHTTSRAHRSRGAGGEQAIPAGTRHW